ncbi:metallophosphoesterase [Moraxella bovis]|nr:metallophosphoesterase [Moraxella bovis]UZA20229.1 metallophosphoesterase [Moraxella bovis]
MIFFNKYKKAMIRILIALLMIVAIIIYSNLLKVVDYKFDNIGYQSDKALNIALITDLHACYYGDNQKWLIDGLKQKQPDVILLGGDIYDDKMPFD